MGNGHHDDEPLPTMVVIVGAGITGAATAYYVTKQSNLPLTIVDAVGPASCSSGKAGAFLPGTCGDGSKREALFRKSFPLHKQLANDLNLQSFRELPAFQVDIEKSISQDEDDSLAQEVLGLSDFDHRPLPGPSAIVDPAELTQALFDRSLQCGAKFRMGAVHRLESSGSCVTSISFEDGTSLEVAEDEDVVIALGPWSCRIEDWLGKPLPLDGILSTSMIWGNIPEGTCDSALFCKEDSNGCHLEVFPRSDQSLYVSGLGGSEVISPAVFRGLDCPDPKGKFTPNLAQVVAAQKSLKRLQLPSISSRPPDIVQACIRPAAPDGMPILGKLLDNVYVATGGGPWGITWGPLMGLSIASMILDEDDEPPIRLAAFKPERFDTLIYRTLLKERSRIDEVT
jgi:glycine/D-amino acid oxidase-like deaminating enzyme